MCKTPTLHFKALNKHNMTHIMYIEMENVTSNFFTVHTQGSFTVFIQKNYTLLMIFCKLS